MTSKPTFHQKDETDNNPAAVYPAEGSFVIADDLMLEDNAPQNTTSDVIENTGSHSDDDNNTDIDIDPIQVTKGQNNEEHEFASNGAANALVHVSSGLIPQGGSKQRIGDQLVAKGLITNDQLDVALHEQKISGRLLGETLVSLGFIDPETLSRFLSESSGFDIFDPKQTIIDGEALKLITKEIASKHSILPISLEKNTALVAMADPYDVMAIDMLRTYLPKGLTIQPMVATPSVISDAIDAAYGYATNIKDILKELETTDEIQELSELSEAEAFTHPIVRLVNVFLFEAVKKGVSDLHFEPEENFIRLRYRLDGVLFTAHTIHKQHWNPISQRLKIMAQLNIADKLAPQDGRIDMNIAGRMVDFRVSSLPTVNGENIVLRVLDKQSSILPLTKLGFSELNLEKIKRAQERPEGIIIVTGPTGSGKSTSLYSMLNEINTVDVNIQTLEDPVEYSIPMIRQTAIREGILDFADGIRAMLRQDPDIIFIGEIRDGVTGNMALKAAMTGHQVYTTLHTNDSFGALPRLYDLGLKPGMIAGAIIAVFAQRLVRVLCHNCKQPHTPNSEECAVLGIEPDQKVEIFKAKEGGCPSCDGAGYKGRTAIVEILSFDEEIDDLVALSASKAEIKAIALEKGFKSLKDDGILKILDGKTSLAELARVVDIRK